MTPPTVTPAPLERRTLIARDIESACVALRAAMRNANDEAITDTSRGCLAAAEIACGQALHSLAVEQDLDELLGAPESEGKVGQ